MKYWSLPSQLLHTIAALGGTFCQDLLTSWRSCLGFFLFLHYTVCHILCSVKIRSGFVVTFHTASHVTRGNHPSFPTSATNYSPTVNWQEQFISRVTWANLLGNIHLVHYAYFVITGWWSTNWWLNQMWIQIHSRLLHGKLNCISNAIGSSCARSKESWFPIRGRDPFLVLNRDKIRIQIKIQNSNSGEPCPFNTCWRFASTSGKWA